MSAITGAPRSGRSCPAGVGSRRCRRFFHPTPFFSTFIANKGTCANQRLGGPCVTLGWPLGGPCVALGPPKGPPKPNPSRQRVVTLSQVPNTKNQVPASCCLFSKTTLQPPGRRRTETTCLERCYFIVFYSLTSRANSTPQNQAIIHLRNHTYGYAVSPPILAS
jgi:hypothetical protein